ncbi:response regulator [Paraburkholderia caffeinilytica]|uniref:response regulator n=1 Tax=Paraburkholderia caffeinilytica TaxID=1761016 RepID=UPI003DA1AB22
MHDQITRVLIADDHPVVAQSIANILRQEPDLQVLEAVTSVPQIFAALRESPVDLLITDYSMPGVGVSDGLVMLEQIKRQFAELRIIVYTGIENPAMLRTIWQSGVHGLVFKGASLEQFLSAYRHVAAGKRFTDLDVCGEPLLSPPSTTRQLSPREAEVLRLFLGRMSISDIALHLGRSIKTVSNQKWAAMRKLGCESDQTLFELYASGGLRASSEQVRGEIDSRLPGKP